jgi:hypothetical protein
VPRSPLRPRPLTGDLLMTVRLLRRLPAYLRNPLTLAEAKAILGRRLERRGRDFLALAREAIFADPGSPYRSLLASAASTATSSGWCAVTAWKARSTPCTVRVST